MESFGMMDPAYFVGKNELLKWLNNTLQLSLVKIEQACTGAVYCQIIDAVHPGKVKMNKINWKAKLEHEYIPNFKILQQAFSDCKIPKTIEVERLIKGKYQDNLEFLQWMKKYYEEKKSGNDYDPLIRRNNQSLELNEAVNKKRDNSKPHMNTQNFKKIPSEKNITTVNAKTNNLVKVKENINSEEKTNPFCDITTKHTNLNVNSVEPAFKNDDEMEKIKQQYQEKIDISQDEVFKCKTEISTLKMSISEIGHERDFYYSKLRDIEMVLERASHIERDDLTKLMKSIIYADKEIEVIFDESSNPSIKYYN